MRVIIHGATGRMGQKMQRAIGGVHTLAAAVSPQLETDQEERTYHSLEEFQGDANLIVDFSHHAAVEGLLDYAVGRGLPVVIGTTGHTQEEQALIRQAAASIPVFCAGNLSVGIAVLTKLARQTAQAFPGAEIEIVEVHHHEKLDVPSGTALMLARGIQAVQPERTLNVGRHENGRRTPQEIGIHSLRMGSVVGIHEIHITTGTQTITLKHEAHDRMLFAEGAVAAAEFLLTQGPGLYDMNSMLG